MINLNMADGIRLMTLRRGVDPRKFALLSFGGAAGLHAAEVARELEIKRIIVPTVASVLSAWGMLTSDLRYEVSRTHYGAGRAHHRRRGARAVCRAGAAGRRPAALLVRWHRLRSSAPPRCATASRSSRSTSRSTASTGTRADLVDRIEDRFHVRHEELYTYASRGQEVVFVNARVAAVGEVRGRTRARREAARRPAPARRAAGGRPSSAAGATFRSMRSMTCSPGHTLDRPRDHRGRDHDRAGRYRRPRHGQCAGMAGYFVALMARRVGKAKRAHHLAANSSIWHARR